MRSNRSKMIGIVIAPILAGLTLVGIAGTASAGNSSYCRSGQVCFYFDANWRNGLGARTPPSSGSTLVNVSFGANDQMSSWENRSSRDGRWYYHANGGTPQRCVGNNRELSYVGFSDNDEMSSFRLYSSGAVC